MARVTLVKRLPNSTAGVVLHALIDLDGNTPDVDAQRRTINYVPSSKPIPEIDVPN